MACEDEIEAQQHVALPSLERFQARTRRCKEHFEAQCVGPGRATQQGTRQALVNKCTCLHCALLLFCTASFYV